MQRVKRLRSLGSGLPLNITSRLGIARCKQCGQSTDQPDRDDPEQAPLRWVKKNRVKHPPVGWRWSGSECGDCFDTRRKWYRDEKGSLIPWKVIKDERNADKAKDDLFLIRRGKMVRGDFGYYGVARPHSASIAGLDDGNIMYCRTKRSIDDVVK